MKDQTQQSAAPSTSTSTTQTAANIANAEDGPFNPFEGEDEPLEGASGEGQQTAQAKPTDPTTAQGQQGQQTAGQTAAQPTQGLTQEAIADIVARTVGQSVPAALQQQAAQQPQQFTEQDFIRTFNVFQPTPELLAKVGLPATPEGAAVFRDEVVTPIVRQAVTMAAYQMEKLKGDLVEHIKQQLQPYEPARQLAVERETEKLKVEFFTTNSDLKDYEPLVMEVYARLSAQGTKWKTKDEAFKTIAEQTRSILKSTPGLQAMAGGGNGQPTTTQGGSGSRMSPLSGGGQGGAARAGGSSKAKSTAEELFGPRG